MRGDRSLFLKIALTVAVVAALQADDGRFFMVASKDGATCAGKEKHMWFVTLSRLLDRAHLTYHWREFHARDDGTWCMLSVHARCWVTAECKLKMFFGPVTCRRAFASGAQTFERWTIHCGALASCVHRHGVVTNTCVDQNFPNAFALKSFHGYFVAIKQNVRMLYSLGVYQRVRRANRQPRRAPRREAACFTFRSKQTMDRIIVL